MSRLRKASRALPLLCMLAAGGSAAPAEAPQLQPLPPPAVVNPALADLGRHLFFEPRLSGDGSRSCASCHIPARGFADGEPLSRGYNGTEYFRNAPGLLSVRLKPRLMWDGRGTELAVVVREMVLDAQFMNGDAGIIAERVRQIPPLFALWRRAFGERSEPRGDQAFLAIGEYLKTLDFGHSAVDAALRGGTRLPPLADQGMRLFTGKAGCVACHHGPLLSDGKPHRLGVPEHPALMRDPLRSVSLLRHVALRHLPNPMATRGDPGVYAISNDPAERGSFITPGLRGLSHTAPYLHNGRSGTLDEVVDFHDRGGGPGSELRPLGLSAQERRALVAFLQALSTPLQKVAEPPAHDYDAVHGSRW
ncbi:MAG: cytochrome c peroxidase [Sulfuritalea sp.]|nr:cytochrome c peroxidase [Sulfuritalea sp.]